MIHGYKDDTMLNLKDRNSLNDTSEDDFNEEEIYFQSFDGLFSPDQNLVLQAISNLTKLSHSNMTYFRDCLAFTKILNIANDPLFDNYMIILHFFNSITSNSGQNELMIFVSPTFLSTLKNFLFLNTDNPDFFRVLFRIYGDIIYNNGFFSQQILSLQFLNRLYDIVAHVPLTSDYFLDLLGCILLRFKLLMQIPDVFHKIREMIIFFISSNDFVVISNVLSTLTQVSSITFIPFVKMFFDPFIINKTIEIISYEYEAQNDGKLFNFANIEKKSFYLMKKDAISIILNFSAIDDETLSLLIECGITNIDCKKICFISDNQIYDVNIQNDLDSSLLPDIASNFFTSNHSNAIQFAYSLFWKSLITNYDFFSFETKQRITRALTLALKADHDEDLITQILSLQTMPYVIYALIECFPTNCIGLELNCIDAIENLIQMYNIYHRITEINLAFMKMINDGFIDEIADYSLNEEEMPRSLIPRVQNILTFFAKYSNIQNTNK